MGHYDDAYERHYAEQRAARLKLTRNTIVERLHKYSDAMVLLGMNNSLVNEAIDHLNFQKDA